MQASEGINELAGAGTQDLGDPNSLGKAPGLQRVEELMRVTASVADEDEEVAVRDLLIPLLRAVQGGSTDVVAVHDKAVCEVLGEVGTTLQRETTKL